MSSNIRVQGGGCVVENIEFKSTGRFGHQVFVDHLSTESLIRYEYSGQIESDRQDMS